MNEWVDGGLLQVAPLLLLRRHCGENDSLQQHDGPTTRAAADQGMDQGQHRCVTVPSWKRHA